jgi:uncharacterized repeat protein (TIGR01451 family)
MDGRKLFQMAVMAGLLLGLLAGLIGLIQATPALAAGSVSKVQVAGSAPGLKDISTRSRPISPPALPPKIPLLQQPILTITKKADPDPVNAGDVLAYTIAVANSGDNIAAGTIITDALDSNVSFALASDDSIHHAGVVSWEVGGIPVGQTITRTLWVTVNQVASGTILSNTAQVTSTEGVNDGDTVTTRVTTAADLALTKSDWMDPVTAGALVIYTLIVTNNGPSNATGVVLTDTLPTSMIFQTSTPGAPSCTHADGIVTCNLDSITSGSSTNVVIRVYSTLSGIFTNQAEVAANEPDPYAANNTASEETTVQPADLSVTKSDSPDPVRVGVPLHYTLTVGNTGPNIATGIVLTDTLPPGVTFQSSNPGAPICSHASGSVTCDLGNLRNLDSTSVTIVVIPTTAGVITNMAEVRANEPDPDPADNMATATTQVNAAADLEVSKGDDPDPVIAGENLTYTLTVTNHGPSDATGIVVTDTLPPGVTFQSSTPDTPTCTHVGNSVTCNLGNLDSSAQTQVTIQTKVDSSTQGALANSASVTGNESDPNGDNNSVPEDTTVNTEADLTVAQNSSPNPASRQRSGVPYHGHQ